MRRGTSWLPNTHIESDGLPLRSRETRGSLCYVAPFLR